MKILSILILILILSSVHFSSSTPKRKIASTNSTPKLAAIISSSDALKARRNIFENKNSNRFYLSTYDFEEDTVGLANIRMAIRQARNGAKVDIVLDAAGHSLSDELLLYMLESGIKVHIFSPKFDWSVFWAKYKVYRSQTNIPGYAIIKALWSQVTHRTHEKLLINYDKTKGFGGELLVGGRNLKDSHFELNNKIAESDVSNKRFLNPMKEHEHEGLVFDIKTHAAASNHVESLMNSDLVKPLEIHALKAKLELSRMSSDIAQEKQLLHKNFSTFQDQLYNWILRYEYSVKQRNTNYLNLTNDLIKIFETHRSNLRNYIDKNLLSVRKLNNLFKQMYGKPAHNIIQTLVEQNNNKSFLAEAIYKLIKVNKIVISQNLLFNSKNILGGPFYKLKKYVNSDGNLLTKFKEFFISKQFDLNKYNNLEESLESSYEKYIRSEDTKSVNWFNKAKEVDQIIFMSDKIEDNKILKHSMDRLFEAIESCEDNCIWNSQYGSLTPRALEAIGKVINLNSSYYRYAEKYLLSKSKNNETKSTELLMIFKSNLKRLNTSLTNPNLPINELKKDSIDIQNFVSNLFLSNEKDNLELSKIINNIQNQTEVNSNLNELYKLMNKNKKQFTTNISESPDKVKQYLKSLQGLIDEDPEGIMPLHKNKTFYFMSNDIKSWTVYADKIIQADFHHTIFSKLRRLGPGLNVIGYNNTGRIHSKVFAHIKGFVLGSNNADPRSELINTETGVYVITKDKGQDLSKEYMDDIKSYMKNQTIYIKNGQLERPKHCFYILTRVLRQTMAPIL